MILHLIHDDAIVPRMISQFEEVYPGNNIYVCVSVCENKDDLRFLKETTQVIISKSKDISNIPWKEIDKVCFHYLTFKKIRCYYKFCIKYNLKSTKNIWFMWGGDIYDILERKGLNLFSEDNSILKIRKANYKKSIKSLIFTLLHGLMRCLTDKCRCYFLDKKIDYIVCNSRFEFELFCKYVSFSKCKDLLRYHYYSLEDTLGNLKDVRVNGNSIIVGNSATASNNHEYILKLLEELDLEDRKIYVPMSYSREENYVKIVEEKFSHLPNAILLNNFLPLEEYHKLLADCSTFIYGNYRQEAWGNILIALYLGGKVYLSEHSIITKGLKASGFIFFTTEEIKKTFKQELTIEEKETNRNIAMKLFSGGNNKKNIEIISNL